MTTFLIEKYRNTYIITIKEEGQATMSIGLTKKEFDQLKEVVNEEG